MIKVSIIIPTYNAEKHIKQCIERLLRQTYKNIELIVVNDASKDNTFDILSNFLDQRLQVINLTNNSGAYCARKTGLKVATGEFILYVDVDDYLEYNAIENLVRYINSYDVDIVKFRYIKEPCKIESDILFQSEKKPFLIENKMNSIIVRELMTTNNLNNLWSMIIRKKVIKDDKIVKRFSMGEDFIQACYIYSNARKILFVDDIYYHYCDNPNGTMRNIKEEIIKNNISDLLYCNDLLHEIIKGWNVEKDYYDIVNARTFNGIADVLISKMYSRENYNKNRIDSILHYLFSNNEYIEFKRKIYNIKTLFLFNNKRKGINRIIFNYYKKQLYKENINIIHIIGFVISIKKRFLRGEKQ